MLITLIQGFLLQQNLDGLKVRVALVVGLGHYIYNWSKTPTLPIFYNGKFKRDKLEHNRLREMKKSYKMEEIEWDTSGSHKISYLRR